MVFEREISGFNIVLRIDDYQSPDKHDFGDWWCYCGFSFTFGDAIHYEKEHDEVLMPTEIKWLEDSFTNLLDDKYEEPQKLPMTEPDFVFILYPKEDLRKNPEYTYIRPGSEIQDIYVEWRIYFWNGGLTDNFLTITLDREDIVEFRDFLRKVMEQG